MSSARFAGSLQVAKTCSATAIKQAYRRLALRLHPDTYTGTEEGAGGSGCESVQSSSVAGAQEQARALHEAFARLQDAYSTLSDPRRRREYDRDIGW